LVLVASLLSTQH